VSHMEEVPSASIQVAVRSMFKARDYALHTEEVLGASIQAVVQSML
jgi:hypothetical protein